MAVVALVVLYLWLGGHDTSSSTDGAPAPAQQHASAAPAPSAAPTAAAPALPGTTPGAAVPDPADPDTWIDHKPPPGTQVMDRPLTAKKPKMNLDERLEEAAKHVKVLERRAELLEKDIEDLDRAGKTKEAAEQRIVRKRLLDHAQELRTDVAERRDPIPSADAKRDDETPAKP